MIEFRKSLNGLLKSKFYLYLMKKETVIDAMTEMPQEFELDILLEKLIFIEKVEKGLKQIRDGKTKTHEEVKEIVKKW